MLRLSERPHTGGSNPQPPAHSLQINPRGKFHLKWHSYHPTALSLYVIAFCGPEHSLHVTATGVSSEPQHLLLKLIVTCDAYEELRQKLHVGHRVQNDTAKQSRSNSSFYTTMSLFLDTIPSSYCTLVSSLCTYLIFLIAKKEQEIFLFSTAADLL